MVVQVRLEPQSVNDDNNRIAWHSEPVRNEEKHSPSAPSDSTLAADWDKSGLIVANWLFSKKSNYRIGWE